MRNCAHFSQFQEQSRRISPHFRLCGGGGSLALTFLCLNSLLTGNLTGNFQDLSVPKPHSSSLSCSFQCRNSFQVKNRAGNFQGRIRESDFVIREPCRESCCWRRTSETRIS